MTAGDQLIAMGLAKGIAKGRAEGLRVAISKLLSARGVTLSEAGRARIEACDDSQLLEQWYERAIVATAEAEIFG